MEPKCPLDGSYLLTGGGEGNAARFVWQLYCPRCDVAFIKIGMEEKANQTLATWKLVDNALQPMEEAASKTDIPHLKRLLSGQRQWVAKFVADRSERRFLAYCPMDGSKIPSLGEFSLRDGSSHVTWCPSCALGFIHVFDCDYAWTLAATFTQGEQGGAFVLDQHRMPNSGFVPNVDIEQLRDLLKRVHVPDGEPG